MTMKMFMSLYITVVYTCVVVCLRTYSYYLDPHEFLKPLRARASREHIESLLEGIGMGVGSYAVCVRAE